jgi:hypothetical protein
LHRLAQLLLGLGEKRPQLREDLHEKTETTVKLLGAVQKEKKMGAFNRK